MFGQDKTNLKNSAKMNNFSHWIFVCFQLRIYDNKHIQLRLDMFDQEQDKRVLIPSDHVFLILFWWHSVSQGPLKQIRVPCINRSR